MIRKAEISDIDQLSYLLTELFTIETDFKIDENIQKQGLKLIIEDQNSVVLLKEIDGKIVGMCTMQRLISTAEGGIVGLIEDMVVLSGNRGRGSGSELLMEMEKIASSMGMKRIQLLADKNNRDAIDFYMKNGWNGTSMICLRRKGF